MKINNFTDPRAVQLPLVLPITHIFIHHCSLSKPGSDNPRPIADADLTGLNLSLGFERNAALGTGCMRPYHVLIRQSGEVDQCLQLTRRGSHGMIYNPTTLAVCTAGEQGLTAVQRAILPEVLADLLFFAEGVPIVGHTSMPAATKPGHMTCPHPTTNVAEIAAEALALQKAICNFDQHARETVIRFRGWQV